LVVVVSVLVYLGHTGLVAMLLANLGVIAVLLLAAPLIPKSTSNRRVPLYGSRFSPMPGEAVTTAPTEPLAIEDRPLEPTAAGAR
jgi:hypothetical protein